MRITFQASQDLLEDDPRNTHVFRSFDDCARPLRLRVIDSVQNEDPNARIDDDHANRRPRRISDRSPSHLTLPASRRMRLRRALRTSRRRARSTTSFVKREPVSCFAVSTSSSSNRTLVFLTLLANLHDTFYSEKCGFAMRSPSCARRSVLCAHLLLCCLECDNLCSRRHI